MKLASSPPGRGVAILLAVIAVVSVSSLITRAAAQPFGLGLQPKEDEEGQASNNNDGEPRPSFGILHPSLPGYPSSSSAFLTAFLDDARTARRRFFSTLFDDDHESPSLRLFEGGPELLHLGDTATALWSPRSFLRGGGSTTTRTASFVPGSLAAAATQQLLPHDSDVVDDHEKFQVSFQLPDGIKSGDVQVTVEDGGTHLLIRGETTTAASTVVRDDNDNDVQSNPDHQEEQQYNSDPRHGIRSAATAMIRFSKSFSLDPDVVEVGKFAATLDKDGRLTVWAPKDEGRVRRRDHAVPVQDLGGEVGVVSDDAAAKANRFDPTNPHILRVPLTPEEQKAEDEKIAEAKARSDSWKQVSQTTL